jgi:hypothetical protein
MRHRRTLIVYLTVVSIICAVALYYKGAEWASDFWVMLTGTDEEIFERYSSASGTNK